MAAQGVRFTEFCLVSIRNHKSFASDGKSAQVSPHSVPIRYHICKSEKLFEMIDKLIIFCQSHDKLAVKACYVCIYVSDLHS